MIGLKRLGNIEECIFQIHEDRVPGDLIETGVWRGGAAIYMKAVLEACGDTSRTVWLADSFEGLPKPNPKVEADRDDPHWTFSPVLAVSLETVKANFTKYGLLDSRVRFLKGWFRDTLPGAPIDRLAVLRLDGDMYESTMDALGALYDKLSNRGFCIIDDYHLAGCRKAVDDFREARKITEPLRAIDNCGVYWRKGDFEAP